MTSTIAVLIIAVAFPVLNAFVTSNVRNDWKGPVGYTLGVLATFLMVMAIKL